MWSAIGVGEAGGVASDFRFSEAVTTFVVVEICATFWLRNLLYSK
jgi:hypothetical protein